MAIMALVMKFLLERPNSHGLEQTLSTVISIFMGVGLYESIVRTVEFILDRSPAIKRIVLGRAYMEGKWYGYYEFDGNPFFFIEVIRQEWSSLSINGRTYDVNGKPHGQWSSVSSTIDGSAGLLHSRCFADLDNGHYDSVLQLQVQGNPPNHLSGYTLDTVGTMKPGKAWMEERKAPDKTSDERALALARDLYKADRISIANS
jgi:hypothetical protein